MKINKKGYLMKLILGYNLNGFDPTEVEITEEKVTFQEHCSQVGANWSCKSINSMITVKCKLLFYMLVGINELQAWKKIELLEMY